MFHAKLPAKTWKKIINALSSIIDEVLIEVTAEGIQFTAMDPSHISMVDFHMGKEHFEEYKVSGEISLGLDIDENRKIINRSKPDDVLTLTADQSRVTYEFQQKDGESKRRFSLPLIEVTLDEKYKVPHLETTATIRLLAYVFEDSIKDAYIIADNVKFKAAPNFFSAFADGDSGNFLVEIKDWLDYEVIEQCESIFNLSYLTDIAKSIEDEVTLELGNDIPLKLSFTLDGAEILFILAPRVDKEE
ncbi:MAG: proliferating cell nuclear antigen (pcna) [Theionarchaea archaeon]|nr:proliferating cell nuclear antigen (pcna) [Theionarchaea archaeon]